MINIIKNAFRLLSKRKGYLCTAIIAPIIITVFFTSLYKENSSYTVGLVNKDKGILGERIEKTLEEIDVVKVKKLEEDEKNINKLVFNEVTMVINIEEDYTEKLLKGEKGEITYSAINKGEMTEVIKGILNNESKALSFLCNNINLEKEDLAEVLNKYESSIPEYKVVNETQKKNVNILATMGVIIYLIFISASLSASVLLEDEREGTRDRILMGKVTTKQYYGGMAFVFFIMTSIPAIEYYILCKIMKAEIGFENHILFLIILLLIVLLAVVFTIMLTTLIKNKVIYSIVNGTLTIPVFMLSGAFWEFSLMSENLQKIGSTLPIRWVMLSIEKLQSGLGVKEILPMILGLIALIIAMFFLSIFFTKNKIVITRED